jgi:hypothetical protein
MAHPLIAHIQCFTRNKLILLLGECLCLIAPAAAKIIDFRCKSKTLTKHNFLIANLR